MCVSHRCLSLIKPPSHVTRGVFVCVDGEKGQNSIRDSSQQVAGNSAQVEGGCSLSPCERRPFNVERVLLLASHTGRWVWERERRTPSVWRHKLATRKSIGSWLPCYKLCPRLHSQVHFMLKYKKAASLKHPPVNLAFECCGTV